MATQTPSASLQPLNSGSNESIQQSASGDCASKHSANGKPDSNECASDGHERLSLTDMDDEEPHFKYQRLAGDIADILLKDAASVLLPVEKFLVLGTHWGKICVLDFNGMQIRTLRSHTASVTGISIDSTFEFVASSSDDGTVMIQEAFSGESASSFAFKRPMKTIALDPDYGKTKRFVAGGMSGEVFLHEQGWISHKNAVIHEGEGPIYIITWNGSFIAWSDDNGVKIYDLTSTRVISRIKRSDQHLRPDLYKCHLYWKSATTLLLGWGFTAQVIEIKQGSKADLASTTTITRHTGISYVLQLDSVVNGMLPHDEAYLVLTYPDVLNDNRSESKEPRDKNNSDSSDNEQESVHSKLETLPIPQIRLINPLSDDPEVCRDAITVHGYQHVQAQDYALSGLYVPGIEPLFFIMSPKDIVIAKPRDANDHIAWLIKRELFEEALDATFCAIRDAKKIRPEHDVAAVGQLLLSQLVEDGNFLKAAATCRKVLDNDAELWERWIYVFAEYEKLEVITPYVPLESPQLSNTVYEIILAHFLTMSPNEFYRLIQIWPTHIYNVKNILSAIEDTLADSEDSKILLKCGAYLYGVAELPAKALSCYIKLQEVNTVSLMIKSVPTLLSQLLRSHALLWFQLDQFMRQEGLRFDDDLLAKWNISSNKISPQPTREADESVDNHTQRDEYDQRFSPSQPIQMITRDIIQIPISVVVEQIQTHRLFLYRYLDALFIKDIHISSEYHQQQLELYAEYCPQVLMGFLKLSAYYSLEKALEVCERRELIPEMVYILGRMGNNKRALEVIMERMHDIREAINFAKEQNDEELWDAVIDFSMKRPDFVKALLENVGSHIDPIKVISRIPKHLEIPHLKDAIVKIMRDHFVQISLRKDCQSIISSDCVNLLESYTKFRRRAFICGNAVQCTLCGQPLFDVLRKVSNFVLLKCQHAFHPECTVQMSSTEKTTQPISKAMLYEKQIKCPKCVNVQKKRFLS